MGEEDQVASLKARHAELDIALSTETARPRPDPMLVADLKKRKLRIKDQLHLLGEAASEPSV